MNKNDKNYYRLNDDLDLAGEKKYNRIIYRTWWMVAVNLLLKILQPFTHDPFLIIAESEMDDDGNPHFIRYCFGRIHFDDGYFERINGSLLSGRYVERYYKRANVTSANAPYADTKSNKIDAKESVTL